MKALTDSGKEAVRRAMVGLPRNEHLAVLLFYTEAMTRQEIGQVLGISEQEAGTLLNRARTKVRRAVKEAERITEAKANDESPDDIAGSD